MKREKRKTNTPKNQNNFRVDTFPTEMINCPFPPSQSAQLPWLGVDCDWAAPARSCEPS